MLPLVFLALLAAALGIWIAGLPAWLVFAAALAAWIGFYVAAWPRIRTYRAAMAVDAKLDAIEGFGWHWLMLHLAGLKVLIAGFVTSMVPFAGSVALWLQKQDLSFFFDPKNPKAQQLVMFWVGAVVFAAPFLMTWLHLGATAEAAETVPADTDKPAE